MPYLNSALIVIEGPDKLGKTTQCINISKKLENSTYQKIPSRDGVTYDRIYEMLKTGEAVQEPYYFQSLQGINRLIWQRQMLPALAQQYKFIIMDRWNPSTWTYGQSIGMTKEQCEIVTRGLVKPDICFVFQGSPFNTRNHEDDSYEGDDILQTEVSMRYKRWADENKDISILIDANRELDVITNEIIDIIKQRIKF